MTRHRLPALQATARTRIRLGIFCEKARAETFVRQGQKLDVVVDRVAEPLSVVGQDVTDKLFECIFEIHNQNVRLSEFGRIQQGAREFLPDVIHFTDGRIQERIPNHNRGHGSV